MNRLGRIGSNLTFIWNKNLWRLLLLLGVVTLLITANGTVQFMQSIVGIIGSIPAFAFQLSFAAFYLIIQFGFLFWFLSRPRKYTVTPDDPQIGMSFADYRGQPDLLEHAKHDRRDPSGRQGIRDARRRDAEGHAPVGRARHRQDVPRRGIAAEANLPFIYIDASSIRGMFWGMTEMMIMKLFRDARGLGRKYAPPGQRGACIVFMDEIDSIGMNRGGQSSGGMMMGGMMMGGSQGLNTLLNQMDSLASLVEDRWRYKLLRWFGIVRGPVDGQAAGLRHRRDEPPGGPRPGADPARPARPDPRGPPARRRGSARHHPALPLEEGPRPRPADGAAHQRLDGLDPDQIKTIINEALIHAHQDGREFLTYKDWLDAADERALGLKQPIRSWNLTDRRETAYHEAGHAVAARITCGRSTASRRRRSSGAATRWATSSSGRARSGRRSTRSRSRRRSWCRWPGHVVENRFLDKLTTGPSSDLQDATQAAEDYVGSLAMGPTKLVVPMQPGQPPIGPVLVGAHELLDQLYEETERLLREKEPAVHYLAKALIERDELIGDELEEVFAEIEGAYPYLRRPYERKVITFRSFAPPQDRTPTDAWQPPAAAEAAADEPAADQPAADGRPVGDDRSASRSGQARDAARHPAPVGPSLTGSGRHSRETGDR